MPRPAFKQKTIAENVAWLRRAFGAGPSVDLPPKAPNLERAGWLKPKDSDPSNTCAPGVSVVVELASGAVFVGQVERVRDDSIALSPWGAPERELSIPIGDIRAVGVVGAHRHRQESEVRRRQARGLPAVTRAKRVKPTEGAST